MKEALYARMKSWLWKRQWFSRYANLHLRVYYHFTNLSSLDISLEGTYLSAELRVHCNKKLNLTEIKYQCEDSHVTLDT